MRIKESTLRRIIREEAQRVLREDVAMSPMTNQAAQPGAASGTQQAQKFKYGDPAELLGIQNSTSGVQDKIQAIQAALNNPQDIIFGINKDQNAIRAYESLKLVLSQTISDVPLTKQLDDVRKAAGDWTRWATMGGRTTMTAENKTIHDFITAAAERLQAGQPVFNFSAAKAATPTKPASNVGYQDEGWKKYLAGDPKRSLVWDAWLASRNSAGLTSPDDTSFKSFTMWWKDQKTSRRFSDNNIGGVAATIQRLKAETNPD